MCPHPCGPGASPTTSRKNVVISATAAGHREAVGAPHGLFSPVGRRGRALRDELVARSREEPARRRRCRSRRATASVSVGVARVGERRVGDEEHVRAVAYPVAVAIVGRTRIAVVAWPGPIASSRIPASRLAASAAHRFGARAGELLRRRSRPRSPRCGLSWLQAGEDELVADAVRVRVASFLAEVAVGHVPDNLGSCDLGEEQARCGARDRAAAAPGRRGERPRGSCRRCFTLMSPGKQTTSKPPSRKRCQTGRQDAAVPPVRREHRDERGASQSVSSASGMSLRIGVQHLTRHEPAAVGFATTVRLVARGLREE